jgi:hypothetical protein
LLAVGVDYSAVVVALLITAVVFPLLFYHHSWSLWLGFDYIVESLPTYTGTDERKTKH